MVYIEGRPNKGENVRDNFDTFTNISGTNLLSHRISLTIGHGCSKSRNFCDNFYDSDYVANKMDVEIYINQVLGIFADL